MLQKNTITEIRLNTPGYSSNRLKTTEANIDAPHFHMHTISSVLNTVDRGDYVFKTVLQDLYFHVLKYIETAGSTYILPSKTMYISSKYFPSV